MIFHTLILALLLKNLVTAIMPDEMPDLPASANGNKAEKTNENHSWQKACTHQKELVDDLRKAGKYFFGVMLTGSKRKYHIYR